MVVAIIAAVVTIMLLVLLLVLRRVGNDNPERNNPLLEGMSRARAEREAAEARLPTTSFKMLVAPDHPFADFNREMQWSGFTLRSPVSGAEPEQATWTDAFFTVQYSYDARVGLRRVEITGRGDAKDVYMLLANGRYTPTLEGHRVVDLLASSDPRDCLLGILAAEWIGSGDKSRYYVGPLDKLRAHPDPEVSAQAQRVLAFMQGQQTP